MRAALLVRCVLWLPVLIFANDARPYAQLAFLTSLGDRLHGAAARAEHRPRCCGPDLDRLGLTHYYALLIVAIQGVMYNTVHRRRAVAARAALAPVLLLLGWIP